MNCYMSIVNQDGQCTTPTAVQITIGKCCCGVNAVVNRYGTECKMCPAANSGKHDISSFLAKIVMNLHVQISNNVCKLELSL